MFLNSAGQATAGSAGSSEAIIFILTIIIIIGTLLSIGIYVYTSFAFRKIARKLGRSDGNIAWIPIFGKPILASRIAEMHWWPILFLLPSLISPPLFYFSVKSPHPILFFVLILIIFVGGIVFSVFYCIWHWKMFEKVGKPGWWILLYFIPYIGWILYLVFLGIAAWSEEDVITERKDKNKA